jgi:GntR family transcriptional regulator
VATAAGAVTAVATFGVPLWYRLFRPGTEALAGLAADGLISSRQGARRIVLGSRRSQSFTELRSFAQWAAATGLVISSARRAATAHDAGELRVAQGSEVLDVLRLPRLDDEPVLVERTVYAGWIADADLLGIRRGSPLLRIRRTTDHTGRPVETSEDHYRSGAVTFEVHNSIDSRPLTRAGDPAWSA